MLADGFDEAGSRFPQLFCRKEISRTGCNSGTAQKFPFAVNTTVELKSATSTCDNTSTLVR
jgi:hypothetical protein